jgi:hypothetical protein
MPLGHCADRRLYEQLIQRKLLTLIFAYIGG